MHMQNSVSSLAKKLLVSVLSAALVLQPVMVSADEVSDAWLQLINSGTAAGTSSSTLAYPQVSSIMLSKWKLVPPDVTKITYTLAAYASNLKVSVKDKNGLTQVSLYDSFQNAGTQELYWGGTTPNGVPLPQGSYVVEVKATSNLGEVSTGKANVLIVPVASQSPVITSATANPSAFSSGSLSTISFAVNAPSVVKMSIVPVGYNASTEPVAEQDFVFASAGATSFTWDGRNKSGNYVSSGDYLAVLLAANDKGHTIHNISVRFGASTFGGSSIAVKPNLTIFEVSPNPFNSVNENLTVKLNLDAPADLTLSVKNQQGETVFTQKSNAQKPAGYNTFTWNGNVVSNSYAGSNSLYVKNGIYTVQVVAENTSGTGVDMRTIEVVGNPPVTQNTQPTTGLLSNVSFSPNPFNVVNDTAVISFWLSSSSTVSYNIFNNLGQEVFASTGMSKSSGLNSVTYSGFNNKSGGYLQPGTYTYTLYSYDANKNLYDQKSGTFQAVNTMTQQPLLSNVSLLYGTFYVQTQNQVFSYTLSSTGDVLLTVRNNQGSIVYSSGSQYFNQSAGQKSITYNGRDNSGALLQTGTYTFTLNSYPVGNSQPSDAKTGVFDVVNTGFVSQNPMLSDVSFTPNTFNPAKENASVGFNLSQSGNVNFQILKNGNTVYTSSQMSRPAGQNYITYTGYDNSGSFLSSGAYSYRVMSYTSSGNVADSYTGSFQVQQTASDPSQYINSYSFSPQTFDPQTTSATVSFNLASPIFVIFRAEDMNGNVRFEKSQFFGSGNNSFTYNGRDNNGNVLPSGAYTYKLLVFKSNGSLETRQGTFSLTTSTVNPGGNAPFIISSSVTPDPYSPYSGPLTVSYNVTASAYVTVLILQDNNIVATLKLNQQEVGSRTAAWDGKLMNGELAPVGNYKFRVSAYNAFGQSNIAEGSFKLSYTGGNQTSVCAGFADVPASAPYCAAIQEMKKLGVFKGYDDGTFRPTTPINRAETVKVILLALKYNVPTTGWWFDSAGFKDVNSTAWYTPYLAAARLYGVINGYPDNTFRADNTVNRAEMLKIFIEAANIGSKYIKCEKPYKENVSGKWFGKYACIASQYSLVDSVEGYFMPAKEMTRGDVAVMIYRAQLVGLLSKLPPRSQIDFSKLPTLSSIPMNPLYPGYPAGYNPPLPPAFLPKY